MLSTGERVMRFRSLLPYFFFILLLIRAASASAFDSDPNIPQDPLADARTAIASKDWPKAITLLKEETAKDPHNADAFNLLGFSQRNAGDMPSALSSYEQALTLNPKHKGAHEYLGETYLKLNNLPKAEAEQASLQGFCPQGCEELDDLNEAIADYKKDKSNK
jgi:tetratricopeptide (TPR) repeat protein